MRQKVNFDRPVRVAKVFLPFQAVRAVRAFSVTDRLAVEVPNHVIVLEITP